MVIFLILIQGKVRNQKHEEVAEGGDGEELQGQRLHEGKGQPQTFTFLGHVPYQNRGLGVENPPAKTMWANLKCQHIEAPKIHEQYLYGNITAKIRLFVQELLPVLEPLQEEVR